MEGRAAQTVGAYDESGSLVERDPNLCVNSHNTPGSTHLLLITQRFTFQLQPARHVCVCAHMGSLFNEQIVSLFMLRCVVCLSLECLRA